MHLQVDRRRAGRRVMRMMNPIWLEYEMRNRYADLLREADRTRLARQAGRECPTRRSPRRRLLARMGRLLMRWGHRLEHGGSKACPASEDPQPPAEEHQPLTGSHRCDRLTPQAMAEGARPWACDPG